VRSTRGYIIKINLEHPGKGPNAQVWFTENKKTFNLLQRNRFN